MAESSQSSGRVFTSAVAADAFARSLLQAHAQVLDASVRIDLEPMLARQLTDTARRVPDGRAGRVAAQRQDEVLRDREGRDEREVLLNVADPVGQRVPRGSEVDP